MPASLVDAQRLIAAIPAAQGRVPAVLANILSTADLLHAQSAHGDPAMAIVKAGAAGELTDKKLGAMLAEAAQRQMIATYTGDTRARIEPLLVREFHNALKNGAADDVLTSMRPYFDEHAKAIAATRAVISMDSSLEHVVNSAQPGDNTIELWQELPLHLSAVAKVGAVAAQFGAGPTASFSLIAEVPGDIRPDNRALFCANGGLHGDSLPFVNWVPGQEHTRSPWARVPLHLNTVEQARERYRAWCADQWEAQHPNKDIQFIRPEDGSVGETTLVNPFKEKELAR